MTSQPGKGATTIHMILNVSRSKGTQTMKFGRLFSLKKNAENETRRLVSDRRFFFKRFYIR